MQEGGEPSPALLLDLSESGLYVRGAADVKLGSAVNVRFRLRANQQLCEASGHIVRRTQVVRLHGFGVRFVSTNEVFAEFVKHVEMLSPKQRVGFLADVMSPMIEVTPE